MESALLAAHEKQKRVKCLWQYTELNEEAVYAAVYGKLPKPNLK
jgi:hypothetical protein